MGKNAKKAQGVRRAALLKAARDSGEVDCYVCEGFAPITRPWAVYARTAFPADDPRSLAQVRLCPNCSAVAVRLADPLGDSWARNHAAFWAAYDEEERARLRELADARHFRPPSADP
jgi:hypothetical protein